MSSEPKNHDRRSIEIGEVRRSAALDQALDAHELFAKGAFPQELSFLIDPKTLAALEVRVEKVRPSGLCQGYFELVGHLLGRRGEDRYPTEAVRGYYNPGDSSGVLTTQPT